MTHAASPAAKVSLQPRQPPTAATLVHLVAIGVSSGGLEALAKVLPALPANFPVPVVIAQHMPPIFTSYWLQDCQRRVLCRCENAGPANPSCRAVYGSLPATITWW